MTDSRVLNLQQSVFRNHIKVVKNIPGIVAFWRCDEIAGSTILADSVGSSSLTISGTATLGNEGPLVGIESKSVDFADADYASATPVPSSLQKNTRLAIGGWVYFDGVAQGGAFLKIGSATTGFGIGVGNTTFDDAGTKLIALHEASRWVVSSATLLTGWNHVLWAVSHLGDPVLCLNGATVYYDTGAAPVIPSGSGEIVLGGSHGGTRGYTGKLAEWWVAADYLDQAFALELYLAGKGV